MNYCNIKKVDIADGPGVRVSLFVSGCRNHCKGCFQPETWDFNYGQEFTADTLNEIISAMNHDYISGLTILGGDPMEPENIGCVMNICREVKQRYPSKSIWLYTGYTFPKVLEKLDSYGITQLMNNIDVIVDGRFVEELKNLSLKFRGSSNQRIIDVHKTFESGEIVLWEE